VPEPQKHVLCSACGHMGCEHLAAELARLSTRVRDLEDGHARLARHRDLLANALREVRPAALEEIGRQFRAEVRGVNPK